MTRVALALVLALATVSTAGCGWRANHRTLEAYRAAEASCEARIDVIVARDGTTEQQDLDDLHALRATCDAELDAILHHGAGR
jgi:hypothetical protein